MIAAAAAAAAALAGLHHDDDRKGGRGKCRYCGQWENNVSYHEAWECPKSENAMFKNLKNRPSRVNPDRLTTEALREKAKKIKWNDEFYKEFLADLRKRGILTR